MKSLQRLGNEVFPVDLTPFYAWGGRFVGYPFRKMSWGPPIWLLNLEILNQAKRQMADVIWIDKGSWVAQRTLLELRALGSPLIVHYTPDPALTKTYRSKYFADAIPQYDLLVTTKSYEIDEHRRLGASQILFQQQGYDSEFMKPEKPSAAEEPLFRSDVAFIGHWEPNRELACTRVLALGVELAIWGPAWVRNCRDKRLLKEAWRGHHLANREYALGWSCARIGLGFLSKYAFDKTTTRTFEIPACGTLMLAERTEEHLELFKEGVEAIYFSDDDELVEKIEYYLAHEDLRARIASAGRARCINSDYSLDARMKKILEAIRKMRAFAVSPG